jgi:HK97 gp10 family phage protein
MPNEFKVEIRGLEGIEKALRDAPKKMAVKFVRKAIKEAAKIVQERIADSAPVNTGFLSEHIKVATQVKSGDEGSLTAHIGPAPQAYYGTFQEFGANGKPGLHFMEQASVDTKDEVLDTFKATALESLSDLKAA